MVRKALVVGIDKYKNPAWNLQGCTMDAAVTSGDKHAVTAALRNFVIVWNTTSGGPGTASTVPSFWTT